MPLECVLESTLSLEWLAQLEWLLVPSAGPTENRSPLGQVEHISPRQRVWIMWRMRSGQMSRAWSRLLGSYNVGRSGCLGCTTSELGLVASRLRFGSPWWRSWGATTVQLERRARDRGNARLPTCRCRCRQPRADNRCRVAEQATISDQRGM